MTTLDIMFAYKLLLCQNYPLMLTSLYGPSDIFAKAS